MLLRFVLIPCRPAIFDLRSIRTTVDITRLAGVPALVVLNAVPARGNRAAEARSAIATYNIPCAPFELGHRVAYVNSVTSGQTAQEIDPERKSLTRNFITLHTYYRRDRSFF